MTTNTPFSPSSEVSPPDFSDTEILRSWDADFTTTTVFPLEQTQNYSESSISMRPESRRAKKNQHPASQFSQTEDNPRLETPLGWFIRLNRYCQMGTPKKEYFRISLLRGCVKEIKHLSKCTKKTFAENTVYASLVSIFKEQSSSLEPLVATVRQLKSLTDPIFASILEKPGMTAFFKTYCQMIFTDSIEEMSNQFGFKCCTRDHHKIECEVKWASLKDFAMNAMCEKKEARDESEPELAKHTRFE